MTEPIKLPPLPINPKTGKPFQNFEASQTQAYARAAIEAAKPHIIAEFLERTGQWVTNKATHDKAISDAIEADRQARGEPVARAVIYDRQGRRQFQLNELGTKAAAALTNGVHDLYTSPQPQQQVRGEPVAEVCIENDYWSRGHFYQGSRKEVKLLKAFYDLPVGANLYAAQPAEPVKVPSDEFRGDNAALASNIRALLDLDAKGALVPHGVGGLARTLLNAAASRLSQPAQPAASAEPVDGDDCKVCAIADSNYAAGMLLGWNLCFDNDEATFSRVREDRLRAAAQASRAAMLEAAPEPKGQ